MCKKITSIILCLAIMLTLTACADTTYSMQLGDTKVKPGVLIMCQFDSIAEANNLFIELYPGVDTEVEGFKYEDYEIDGVEYVEWIRQRAVEMVAELLMVERLFDERGLSFTAEEKATFDTNISDKWDTDWGIDYYYSIYGWEIYTMDYDSLMSNETWGERYSKSGVSIESFEYYYLTVEKSRRIFSSIYDEDGTNPVSAQEWQEVWERDYARYRRIDIDITDEDGDIVSESELVELEELGDDLVKRLVAGEEFADVAKVYDDYMDEKYGVEEEYEDEDDEDYDEDEDYNEDSDGEEDEEDEEEEEDDPNYYDVIVKSDSTDEPELVEKVFSMGYNEPVFFKTETEYYVLVRLEILEREDLYESYRDTVVYDMKNDEFVDDITEQAKVLLENEITVNAAAYKRYDPKNLY